MIEYAKIVPSGLIDSISTIGIEYEYYDAISKEKANTDDIETAIRLGLSIEPKYVKVGLSKIKLRIRHSILVLSKEQFYGFISLFELMSGKITYIRQDEIKTILTLPLSIGTKLSNNFKGDSITITFPNGKTGEITAKMAKMISIARIIPEEYFSQSIELSNIIAYNVKYFQTNQSFKVGCNTIKAFDLFSYFDEILTEWDKLDERLKHETIYDIQ